MAARLRHEVSVGASARLEFMLEASADPISVEVPRSRLQALALRCGDVAWLRPVRVRRFEAPHVRTTR